MDLSIDVNNKELVDTAVGTGKTILVKLFKYILHWLVVYMAINYVAPGKVDVQQLVIISVIVTISFAVLDMFAPTFAYHP